MPTTPPESTQSLDQPDPGSASEPESTAHSAVVTIDREGTIEEITEPARRALEYPPEASISPCFFSHVHGRNLRRVMRDLAHMVSYRKQRARWLLRLRTGTGRWRWFRAIARNRLSHPDGTVRVHFRPL